MGKKKAARGANVQNLQAYQRMNFLYQAAMLMANTNIPNAEKRQVTSDPRRPKWQGDETPTLAPLGRFYNYNMKKIARRLVLRVDPSIKRTICKCCDATLIPVISSTTSIQSHPETAVITTCKVCGTNKRFVAKRGHRLFSEKPEHTTQQTGSTQKVTE